MENILKFYLLAEKAGWDTSFYAFEYRSKLPLSDSYQILSYNVIEAKKHLSKKAKEVCEEFENLNFEPHNLEEAFILETKINYLSLHSFPEFYLNPFAVDPSYSGEITSIGDLFLDCMGKQYSFNELIEEKTIPLDMKKEVIKDKVEEYLFDMEELASSSIQSTTKRAFGGSAKERGTRIRTLLDIVMAIGFNVFFFFTLIYPLDPYWNCFYHPSWNSLITYTCYLFPIFLFLYDFFFALFHSYRAKISEPYNYARRFLKKHSQKVYDDIEKTAHLLENYLFAALENHVLLKNDIKDFSKLSTSYVDFKKVLSVESLKNERKFIVFRTLNNVFATIAFVVFLVSFVAYIFCAVLKLSF